MALLGGGIRRRLWLGIGGLLTLQLLTAALAVRISLSGYAAIEQTLKNNGDSLAYMHELTQSVDQLDAWARAQENLRAVADDSAIRGLRAKVDLNVAEEFDNTSERGEREAALDLRATWEAYQAALRRVLQAVEPARRRALGQRELEPLHQRLQALAWEIADLNLKNARFRNHGRDLLDAELRLMVLLLVIGTGAGVAFAIRSGQSLLNPVLELTEGVRALGRGHLDGQVRAAGDDELGELGRAFNAMSRRLHGYEQGFRARLLRVQHTTQLAINSFSDPVAVFGMDRRVELCNRASEKLFDLGPGRALDSGPLAALGPWLEQVLVHGRAYEPTRYGDAIRVERLGKERYILPRLVPVSDSQGRIVGATLVLADVSSQRRLDGMKSGLLATVSHELKNPLTGLRMAAHLLVEDASEGREGRRQALLDSIKDNAERLHWALEGLLDLGRLESGDLLNLELRPAGQVLDELMVGLRPPLERQGIHLELAAAQGLPAVAADAGRLKHVFSNLLDNAARHSPPGAGIQVGAELAEGRIRYWVRNQGPTVPEEFRDRIFERFFRVPGQPQGSGLGLGLAIAREIVELHGGNLVLDPTEDGATFSLWLPLG